MPLISIIVVNYNGREYLPRMLDALRAQTFRDFELILLDNASSDGSADAPDMTGLPAARLIRETDNHGYARGNNLAVKQATGEWLVLLNPDTQAAPDFLEQFVAASTAHPDVNAFAGCQYLMQEPGKLDGVGDAYCIFGFPWRGGFGHPVSALPGPGEVFSACGAAAMIRRSVYLAHGGFDERFFMYCEDVDFGFRLRLAGETCRFVPEASVQHAASGISGRTSERTLYHGTRNRVWTYFKNMPAGLLVLTLPGHLVLSAYLLMRAAMTGTGGPIWRGMRDGFAGALRLRASNQWRWTGKRASSWHLARAMAWNPFRMSRRLPHVRTDP